jgi:hypothetical protein
LPLRISSSRRGVSAAQSGSSFGSGPTCAMRASYHSANYPCSRVDSFSKAVAISVAVLRSKTMERLTPTATQPGGDTGVEVLGSCIRRRSSWLRTPNARTFSRPECGQECPRSGREATATRRGG